MGSGFTNRGEIRSRHNSFVSTPRSPFSGFGFLEGLKWEDLDSGIRPITITVGKVFHRIQVEEGFIHPSSWSLLVE